MCTYSPKSLSISATTKEIDPWLFQWKRGASPLSGLANCVESKNLEMPCSLGKMGVCYKLVHCDLEAGNNFHPMTQIPLGPICFMN